MSAAVWPEVIVRDVCESVIDCVNKTAPVVDYETPYKMIRTTNVKNGVVNTDSVRNVDKDIFDKWTRRAVPRVGDVILTREAPLGDVGMLTKSGEKIFLGQRLMQYRTDPEKLDNYFLLYALQEAYMQGQLKAAGSGSTVEHIRVGDAENLKIRLPDIKTQKILSSILKAYDNLIENNKRRIAILEEMAQSLYHEWFVNFRFPSFESTKFIDSSLGKMPEGWVMKKLSDIADVNPESITKKNIPEEIKYIDISSVGTDTINETKDMFFAEAPSRARRIVRNNDIIWATVRPNRKQYAFISRPLENTIVSTGFAVLRTKDVPASFLYKAVTTDEFAAYLVNHASGAAYPAVNATDFEKAELLVPDDSLLKIFDDIASPITDQKECFKRKNDNLILQRDLLLPKLISGMITV